STLKRLTREAHPAVCINLVARHEDRVDSTPLALTHATNHRTHPWAAKVILPPRYPEMLKCWGNSRRRFMAQRLEDEFRAATQMTDDQSPKHSPRESIAN